MGGHRDRIRSDLDSAHRAARIGDLSGLASLDHAVAARATTVMNLELSGRRLDSRNVGLILARLPFQTHSTSTLRTDQWAVHRDLLVDALGRSAPRMRPIRASGLPTRLVRTILP